MRRTSRYRVLVALASCSVCTSGLLGCTGFATVEADPDSPLDAPTVEPRCYDDAHTMIVGPGPGCASLTLRVEDDFGQLSCDDVPYTPLRVIRRGALPVRLRQTMGNNESHPDYSRVVPASTATTETCCELVARPEADRSATRAESLPFEEWVVDDTVELRVVYLGTLGDITFEACAIEDTEARRSFRDRCYGACETDVECGFAGELEECRRRCNAETARENEACLQARVAGIACERDTLPACESSLLDRIDERCAGPHTREYFECITGR